MELGSDKMRYVIVSVIKGEAGDFNNNLRKEVYDKFKAKSSKLALTVLLYIFSNSSLHVCFSDILFSPKWFFVEIVVWFLFVSLLAIS